MNTKNFSVRLLSLFLSITMIASINMIAFESASAQTVEEPSDSHEETDLMPGFFERSDDEVLTEEELEDALILCELEDERGENENISYWIMVTVS